MRHNQFKFDRNSTLKERTLLSKRKHVFVYISPCNAPAWLKYHKWHSITMCQHYCKFRRNRAATKGTLFFRPKKFLVTISLHICSGGLEHYTWHSLDMLHNQWKFGRCRRVSKGTLFLRPKQFFVPISPRTTAGRLKHHTRQTYICATTSGSTVEMGQLKKSTLRGRNMFSSLFCLVLQLGHSNITRRTPTRSKTNESLVEIDQ
jgi:hypothetical protein